MEARAGKFPGPSLIPALNAIQARLGWLPRAELEELARDTRRPRYEIEGLISFYPHFRTDPPAKVALHVCHDLPCYLRGGEARLAELRERYGDDAEVELVEVSCLGRCDIAPAVAVNERPAPVTDADALVAAARTGDSATESWRAGPVKERAEPWPNDPYPAGSGVAERYASLRALLAGELDPDTIVHTLKGAGLRGMGGAGFPTGQKWELVRGIAAWRASSTPSATPTNRSRARSRTSRSWPSSRTWCWRGCCWAWPSWAPSRAGCSSVTSTVPRSTCCAAELDALRAAGVIGPDACGSGRRLDVEVFVSPGGYILGEETALLECMEGHRGEPRNKPPFPGNYGLHGRPTLINSVETLADVPVIVQRGAQWWSDQGAGDSVGWKFFAVSGHVERPDVYCVPMGTTVRERDRAGRRRERRPEGRGGAAGRGVVELHRAGQAGHAAGLRYRGGERHDARVGGAGRAGRGHRPAGRVDQRAAVLPQRVVRQVRAVPTGLDQGVRRSCATSSSPARNWTTTGGRTSCGWRRPCARPPSAGWARSRWGPW